MNAGLGDTKNAAGMSLDDVAELVADFRRNCEAALQSAQKMLERTHDLMKKPDSVRPRLPRFDEMD